MTVAIAASLTGSFAFASPPGHKKRSKSDADINAIGQRKIDRDPNFYSSEKEQELGKQLEQEVERLAKLLRDPAIMDYVERITQNVARNADKHMPIKVQVIDSEAVEAFTLPGGYQYIDRGLLLRLEGEGELASLLARGIAHTAMRSATSEVTKGEIAQLATIPLMTVPGPNGTSNKGDSVAIPLVLAKWKQEDELDADYFGVQYVYKAGYDPECFTRLVQRIWGSSPASGKTVDKMFSSFPPAPERLEALEQEIAKILPKRDGAIVSTPEFQEFKERLHAWKSEDAQPKNPAEEH